MLWFESMYTTIQIEGEHLYVHQISEIFARIVSLFFHSSQQKKKEKEVSNQKEWINQSQKKKENYDKTKIYASQQTNEKNLKVIV